MNPTVNTNGYVEEAQKGSARYVYLPAMVAAIGGLLFGFDTAVINGAIVFIKRQFLLSDSQTEIAASSLLLGCVVGASLAALTSDRFGRKKVLLGAAALFTISSIGAALPRDLLEFVIARFVGGVAIGMASTLSPLYIAEISPAAAFEPTIRDRKCSASGSRPFCTSQRGLSGMNSRVRRKHRDGRAADANIHLQFAGPAPVSR